VIEQSGERQQSSGLYRSPVTVKTLARLIDCRSGKLRSFALGKVQYRSRQRSDRRGGRLFCRGMIEAKVDVRASSD
jgi:hypothetical protein